MTALLLDLDAAAERLGVSRRWLKQAVGERRVQCTRVGRYVRFSAADLDAFIAQHRAPAVSTKRKTA